MNFFRYAVFSLALVFLKINFASSGLMFEPMAAYESSEHRLINSAGVNAGAKNTGLTIGGRAGYRFSIPFWIAGDYQRASGLDSRESTSGANVSGSLDRTNVYVDVGFDFPILLRVWAGYGIVSRAKVTWDQGGITKRSGGRSWKVGAGIRPLLFLSINFEYFSNDFSKLDHPTLGNGDLSRSYPASSDKGFLIGISAPLNL